MEVLRATGVRIEELLEISHHSRVQYRLPATGELVPLLQITPSKTDAERLLLISPELAEVLSTIIRRVRTDTGAIPTISAYDRTECVWLAPSPWFFQRRIGTEHRRICNGTIRNMLNAALTHTGLTDPTGGRPLHYNPHDFRRNFITDAILSGLHRISLRSSPGTGTSTSPSATKRSTPTKRSSHTWRFWAAGAPSDPPRSTGRPPTRNGKNSSVTSNAAKSPPAPAAARSPPPASAAPCSGPLPVNNPV